MAKFTTGKKFEKHSKRYNEAALQIADKRAELEKNIEELETKIKDTEVQIQIANAEFQFNRYKDLKKIAVALQSDKAELEAFRLRAIKIIPEMEAKEVISELEKEYNSLLKDFDNTFYAKYLELIDIVKAFEPINREYNRLVNDYQFGSTGKYQDRLLKYQHGSKYWSLAVDKNLERIDGKNYIV